MKRIAVFTSGGDAPGMNACIRSVVRTALYNGLEVMGIKRGYDGMIQGDFELLDASSVANIIHRGGTILKTARSKEFMTQEGREKAFEQLQKNNIEGLVAIGGDGTFQGAHVFASEFDIPIVGAPGTIDNDLVGTDFTIGYDTALNTVVEAVDKIRDTAESHDRLFIVEVMGKDAGLIALRSGIAAGAEAILIPEVQHDKEALLKKLAAGRKSKTSKIIIVAEGDEGGGANQLAKDIHEQLPNHDVRVSILGHMQRGGNPTCMERVLASRLGFAAVEALQAGKKNVMVGVVNKEVSYTPFEEAIKHIESPDATLMKMVEILSL